MARRNKPPDFLSVANKIKKDRPRFVAIEAKKFFKESFIKGGFTDAAFQPWQDKKSPLGGKKILVGANNSMNLMQTIRTLEQSETKVRTGTEVPYGEYHNDGATATVTEKMKKFWWAKYYEFAGKRTRTSRGKLSNNASNRSTSAKAEYCKRMALMKVGSKIKIPKRQFIGESKTLMNEFEKWFEQQINNASM